MSVIAFPPAEENTHYARLSPDFFQQRTIDNRPRTLSPKKLAANRANAKKSTGPRTPAGKARSAQNATTHGLTAATAHAIPFYKDDPTYVTIRGELEEELRPNTPAQHSLVAQLAHITFQLEVLFPLAEHQILNTPLDKPGQSVSVAPDFLPQDLSPTDPRRAAPVIAHHFLQNAPTPLTRLWDHRRRLLSRYQSILRQLPQLQRQAQAPAQEEREARRRQIGQDHAFLDEQLEAIHQRNKEKQRASRAQNEPTQDPEPIPEDWFDTGDA
jgi:hypothetical protein